MLSLNKTLVAFITFMRLFSAVGQPVSLLMLSLDEGFVALVTFEQLFSSMSQ